MKKLILFFVLVLCSAFMFSQIDENTGWRSRGLTSAQLDALPIGVKTGLTIMDTTLGVVVSWDGSEFVPIASFGVSSFAELTGSARDNADLDAELDLKADDNAVVKLTGTQTVTGNKSFTATINAADIYPDTNASRVFGTESFLWNRIYQYRSVWKTSDGNFWMVAPTVGNDLGMGKNASSTASFTSQYIFKDGGPSSGKDVATAEWVQAQDALNVGLTNDQTISGLKTFSGATTFSETVTLNSDGGKAFIFTNSSLAGINPTITLSRPADYFYLQNNESAETGTSYDLARLNMYDNGDMWLYGNIFFKGEAIGVTGTEVLTISATGDVDSMPTSGLGTDSQTLALSGTNNSNLAISGGNSVTVPNIGTANQTVPEDRDIQVTGANNSIKFKDDSGTVYFEMGNNSSAEGFVKFGSMLYDSDSSGQVYFENPFKVYAASSPPTSGEGGLWYDTTNNLLKIYDAGWEIVSGSLTTEQSLRIDNLNVRRKIVVSSDDAISTSANARTVDSPYEGKVHTVVNGNYNFLLNNAEPLNTLFTIEAGELATDSIVVKRNNTDIKFVIDGVENGVVADDYDGFSLRHLKTALVERTANNKYKVSCSCYPFTDVPACTPATGNLNTGPNAASDANCNEANATTGFHSASVTLTSDPDSTVGDYALKGVATALASSYIGYTFSVVSGRTYNLTCKVRQTIGSSGILHTLAGDTLLNGDPRFQAVADNSTVWESKSYTMTATGSGSVTIGMYAANSGSIGDTVWVDDWKLIETTP